jgi:nucleoid-associated protein YgaU
VYAYLPVEATSKGAVRNLAWAGWLKLVGYDFLGIESAYKYVCTGIADAAAAAINRAKFADVSMANAIPNNSGDHWGVQVQVIVREQGPVKPKVRPGGSYVFDWWATLDTANPVVCHEADWKADKGGVLFANFTGFADGGPAPAGRVQPRRGVRKPQKTYVVKAGDTLSAIAKKEYGSAARWRKIYDANKAVIGSNPDVIKVNMTLVIPV